MLEFTAVMLPLDDNLQTQLDALKTQGFMQVPGTKQFVVYMLCRPANAEQVASGAGFGKFAIDESKVAILRDGKLIGPDGKEIIQN
jgi:hypothetical protein